VAISEERIQQAFAGTLPVRPSTMPVYEPNGERIARLPLEFEEARRRGAG
jgi:hypothetical protein